MEVLLDTCGRRDVKSLLLLTLYLFFSKAAANCPKPQGGENTVLTDEALLMNEFPDGSQITLECANGYVKESGSGTMDCVGGQWSEPALICKKKDCGKPTEKPNMHFDINDGTLFGASVRVVCDEGYQISGSAFVQCYAHGWSGRFSCETVTCEIPGKVDNGNRIWNSTDDDDPKYGTIIKYTCNEGYTLTGNEIINCTNSGEYNYPPPVCKAVTCEIPDEVANSKHNWTSTDDPERGTIIKYTCNEGYTLTGNDTITCTKSGEYDSQPPVCKGNESTTVKTSSPPPRQVTETTKKSPTTETTHRDKTTTTSTVSPSTPGYAHSHLIVKTVMIIISIIITVGLICLCVVCFMCVRGKKGSANVNVPI